MNAKTLKDFYCATDVFSLSCFLFFFKPASTYQYQSQRKTSARPRSKFTQGAQPLQNPTRLRFSVVRVLVGGRILILETMLDVSFFVDDLLDERECV